jgi:hypothetical protein
MDKDGGERDMDQDRITKEEGKDASTAVEIRNK